MEIIKGTGYPANSPVSATDVLMGNSIVQNAPTPSVLVSSENDLSRLSGYNPGTIAYAAGFKAMWQLSVSGEWVNVIGGE